MVMLATKVARVPESEMFDASHLGDQLYLDNPHLPITNPFAHLSSTPHGMIKLTIDELRAKLRAMVFAINRAQWDPAPDPHSGEFGVDLYALRKGTEHELRTTTPVDPATVRDCAALRRFLNDFDMRRKGEEDAQRVRKLEQLTRRLAALDEQEEHWNNMIASNSDASARHAERLKDREAYGTVQVATAELADIERRRADTASELEYLTRNA